MRQPDEIHNFAREQIRRIAEDIYIYGYPLLVMDVMKRMHTATPRPSLHSAPVNQFAHRRFIPGPQDRDSVYPNVDCLQSRAWLDLSREPVVLRIPRNQRYYLFSFFSNWYEVFDSSSPRTTKADGCHLAFVSPAWNGKLPAGLKKILAPTECVWIDGLIDVDGAEDIQMVNRLQDQFHLAPLSEWSTPPASHSGPYRIDVDHHTPAQEQVARLDARAFFTRLARLLRQCPRAACDAEIMERGERIGFRPSEELMFDTLPDTTKEAMHSAVAAARLRIDHVAQITETTAGAVNNWRLRVHPGRYGTSHIARAAALRSFAPSALADDLVCFHTSVDREGEELNGSCRYRIHFSQDRVPPVNAFWSMTLYGSRHHLAQNGIQRHAVGSRYRLKLHEDSSLYIYVQHDWPGESRDCNWLPAPKESFSLALRMYWPKPHVVTGEWQPPYVERTN